MKNLIKKILLTLLLTLSIGVKSQNQMTFYNNHYNKWYVSNQSCYGCGSFYIMIVNTPYPDNYGMYYYDIYLWSNSFYSNGYAASSYIKNIKIYTVDPAGNEKFILKLDYALVAPKSQYFDGNFYLAYVYSGSAMQRIKITWSEINPW